MKNGKFNLTKILLIILSVYTIIFIVNELIALLLNIQYGMIFIYSFVSYEYFIVFIAFILVTNIFVLIGFVMKKIHAKIIGVFFVLSIISIYTTYLSLYCSTPDIFGLTNFITGSGRFLKLISLGLFF